MLRCKEVVHRVTSEDPGAMPFLQRVAIRFHLVMCRHCRAYVRSLKRLRAAARVMWRDIATVDPQRLDRIRSRLQSQLASEQRPESGP